MPIVVNLMLDGNDFLLNAVADDGGICSGRHPSVFNNAANNPVNMEVAAVIINCSLDFPADFDIRKFFHINIASNKTIDMNKSISVSDKVIFDCFPISESE